MPEAKKVLVCKIFFFESAVLSWRGTSLSSCLWLRFPRALYSFCSSFCALFVDWVNGVEVLQNDVDVDDVHEEVEVWKSTM